MNKTKKKAPNIYKNLMYCDLSSFVKNLYSVEYMILRSYVFNILFLGITNNF